MRYEVHDIVSSGDMVAIRATAHFFRSRDGRLSEHWGIRDELDVLYQVGARQPPRITPQVAS